MFAQDDGAVVIKLEKMSDVTVNQESKVIIHSQAFNIQYLNNKYSRNTFSTVESLEQIGLSGINKVLVSI